MGSGFRTPETPSKAAGPRELGQTSPGSPYGEWGAGGENDLRCFLYPRRVGAVVCCPSRVSLCRMQLSEAHFGQSVRRGLGAEWPSWLRGHGWGLGAEGLRAPNPASPRRRTRGEWVSGTGDPQQSSRAQGARGSPAPLCPLESRGPGAKTACVAFLSPGALGLLLAARGDFPFAECSHQKLVLGRRFNRPRAVRPSWLREHGCGVGPEGFRAPNPASLPRRTLREWDSGAGDPQQSSRA